eukprot:TRINITY_DN30371_c0_g1_i1.p2 TRINITY_DN30371_c0_g1~~TRINITY_DN30371_c0_g1_i1.p2  ORF type:complete len:135 (-),score=10.65 TRINITY_DN30371_c0_g1_i1:125-529(-)
MGQHCSAPAKQLAQWKTDPIMYIYEEDKKRLVSAKGEELFNRPSALSLADTQDQTVIYNISISAQNDGTLGRIMDQHDTEVFTIAKNQVEGKSKEQRVCVFDTNGTALYEFHSGMYLKPSVIHPQLSGWVPLKG